MEAAPARAGRKVLKIALIVLSALFGLGTMGLAAWGIFLGFERPLEVGDRDVLVTFELLAHEVGGLAKAPNAEKTLRKRFIDGSYEISYEYEDENLFISSSVNHERSNRDARQLFTMTRVGMPLGAKAAADVEIVPRSDLYSGGDDRYCAAMKSRGAAGGHVLVVLQGKNVMTLTIGGAFLDSPAAFQALVQPRIDALARLR